MQNWQKQQWEGLDQARLKQEGLDRFWNQFGKYIAVVLMDIQSTSHCKGTTKVDGWLGWGQYLVSENQ